MLKLFVLLQLIKYSILNIKELAIENEQMSFQINYPPKLLRFTITQTFSHSNLFPDPKPPIPTKDMSAIVWGKKRLKYDSFFLNNPFNNLFFSIFV